ncbi:MAG: bifunctional metallophosphatase/5'-nucleotidase [Rubrivivax sp.]|nr:bifunctional metallophosphatase/5'-nucleotidase [Rubrivivax sp.]
MLYRRFIARALPALALALALAGCATPAPPAPAGPVTVRLIAFNDFHGNLEPGSLSLPWGDPEQPGRIKRLNAGGAAFLSGTVQALREGAQHSILIHSGDLIGGTPLVSALFRHESTIDIANRIGVDIAIPGNHEFDAGKDELLRVLRGGCGVNRPEDPTASCPFGQYEGAKFPMFAANVVSADGKTLFPPSVVRSFGGVRIGFIGAVTKITPSIVVPSGVAGLRFIDEAEAINAEARKLQGQGVRALVAVIHEGGDTGTPGQPLEWNDAGCPRPRGAIFEIVKRLDAEIDVVFSAHTHQGYRCVVDGRPIMQATALGRGLSVADVVIDPRSGDIDRARTTHRNVPVFNAGSDAKLREAILAAEPEPWASALRKAQGSQAIAARVAEYAQAAAPRAQRPVGRIGGSFDRSGRTDSSAGRLIADSQFLATRAADRGSAEFALMNPGGVRTDLLCRGTPPCPVTYGDIFSMQPFGNSLVVMTLSGADFKKMLEDQQSPGRTGPHFLIPSSTLTYRWDAKAPYGERVKDLRVGGRPLDLARDVRFTVNSFLAEGGDGFVMLRTGRNRLGGELDLDALTAHLGSGPAPDPVPRISFVE